MEDAASSNKRCRDELDDSPEAKRLRADLLLDILNDDAGGAAAEDIANVIKSLEEEISLPPSPPVAEVSPADPDAHLRQPELGYLLEASDDELGLPPPTESEDGGQSVGLLDGEPEDAGFGQIWGFDDEFLGCFGSGMDFRITVEDGEGFDGGIFGYFSDELFVPSDLSWRPETLPTV